MKTVAFISQKGGSGKTTTALHAAVAAHEQGLSVAIVDVDPQASAFKWHRRRRQDSEKYDPEVVSLQAEAVPDLIEKARSAGGDLVILDTAPNSDRDVRTIAKVSDLIIIPSRVTVVDIEAVENTWELSQVTKRPAFVLFNQVMAQSPASLADAKAYITAKGIPTCPFEISHRKIFSDAFVPGLTATEVEPKGKGAAEVRKMMAWITNELGKLQ
jgi:chromosome partitioning protein